MLPISPHYFCVGVFLSWVCHLFSFICIRFYFTLHLSIIFLPLYHCRAWCKAFTNYISIMKSNKSGKRMYSDSYIDVATSNRSARLICVITALSLEGLRDLTSIKATADWDLFTYEREGVAYFVRMDGNNIAERNLLSRL